MERGKRGTGLGIERPNYTFKDFTSFTLFWPFSLTILFAIPFNPIWLFSPSQHAVCMCLKSVCVCVWLPNVDKGVCDFTGCLLPLACVGRYSQNWKAENHTLLHICFHMSHLGWTFLLLLSIFSINKCITGSNTYQVIVHHSFPGPTVMSSDLFCQSNRPKFKKHSAFQWYKTKESSTLENELIKQCNMC